MSMINGFNNVTSRCSFEFTSAFSKGCSLRPDAMCERAFEVLGHWCNAPSHTSVDAYVYTQLPRT
ncbi:hypothetical protein L917_17486 [Phytophthora nicotianae]|uniref:Uncharacterized protein n=1 Tax=Phytophthora nicotianae TaxID=4792 RepID=W2MGX4_PHYNI|nr:hypothetical protein L917_17486 [Phytophthora nicotianae]ETM35565.1 hypothetical protein L914_17557 [Phytophthora nicotianae]